MKHQDWGQTERSNYRSSTPGTYTNGECIANENRDAERCVRDRRDLPEDKGNSREKEENQIKRDSWTAVEKEVSKNEKDFNLDSSSKIHLVNLEETNRKMDIMCGEQHDDGMNDALQEDVEPFINATINEDGDCGNFDICAMERVFFESLTADQIRGMEFESHLEAETFYEKYARVLGFGVRKFTLRNNVKGEVIWRRWVCSCQGFRSKKHVTRIDRKRGHRPLTRFGCKAEFRVRRCDTTLKWFVSKFVDAHTGHNLVDHKYSHLIRSHRSLSNADIAQVNSMRACGIKTSHIMGFMVGQSGGYGTVGFTRKDLYNHFDRERRERLVDGDAISALCYLQAKADNDPMLFVKYTVDSDKRLQNLFWADGQSIIDYQCFSDVLCFDTTYKKNMYNKPLVIFSGVNHHGQNVIFGAGLLVDETEKTYKWVLSSFDEAMSNKKPFAVVTDGDKAMRKAIKAIFPDACHRLCSWHLQQNAHSNIKDSNFQIDFKGCMYGNFGEEEFELKWNDMVDKFGLHENVWIQKLYKKRRLWANAYLRKNFFAGVRTTSRCESINGFIGSFVQGHDSLVDLLHHFERALKEYRNNELMADFKSQYSIPVTNSALACLEKQVSNFYTYKAFLDFHHEVDESTHLILVQQGHVLSTSIYKLCKYTKPNEKWKVLYERDKRVFHCNCSLFESYGIPCRHILCVMKHEHMNEIPPSLICKRWTKTAKSDVPMLSKAEDNSAKVRMLRYGSLASSCNWLSYLAAQDEKDYAELKDEIAKRISLLESRNSSRLSKLQKTTPLEVADPVVTRTKGRPPRANGRKPASKKCKLCKGKGHNQKTCPMRSQDAC